MFDWITHLIDGAYGILYIGVIALFCVILFGFLANKFWSIFKGTMKRPLWLQRILDEAKNITSFPRALGRVIFTHPLRFIEETEITLIILSQKLRSRVALLIICLWGSIFLVISKPNADFNLFVGLGTLIGASTFIMLRFMGMSENDKKREHEKMMSEVRAATEAAERKEEKDA